MMIKVSHQLKQPLQAIVFPLIGHQTGFVFRSKDGGIHAYANVCAHRGIELDNEDQDFFNEEELLRCKVHDAKFDIKTGVCVGGPKGCLGKRLFKLEVQIIDDEIHIGNIPKDMLDYRDFKKS